MRGSPRLERIVVENAGRITFLNVDEIDWSEAADNDVQLHASGTAQLVHGTLAKLEGRTYRERLELLVTSSF